MAASRSASENTMNGAFPPNSRDTRLTVSAHPFNKILPTAVDPVNESFLTTLLAIKVFPTTSGRLVVMTFRTPLGKPASSTNRAKASAESGVNSDGLTITVQPTAKAGATFLVIIADGKFHGVMAATTPMGCLSAMILLSAACEGITSP